MEHGILRNETIEIDVAEMKSKVELLKKISRFLGPKKNLVRISINLQGYTS